MNYTKQSCAIVAFWMIAAAATHASPFPVPDTGEITCYGEKEAIDCPSVGEAFFGQDAQVDGTPMDFTDNGDGTVTDNVTGLMWVQTPDINNDGEINIADKMTYDEALAFAETLDVGGYDDWRIPDIKEMYSLMDFRGVDPSGFEGTGTSELTPFIDRDYFDFGYGDTEAGERVIDAQLASSTLSVSGTGPLHEPTMFGVNYADGRIKGYGLTLFGKDKTFYVMAVRGDEGYGENAFTDNGDQTVTDAATGLMWTQNDSGNAMSWEDALAWAERANDAGYLGYDDWRLPNVKELQILVDYTRSPDTSDSAAIDPVFSVTNIVNEAGEMDYPVYWTSTTHANWTKNAGNHASYVNFGRAMGYMRNNWVDVHGAGAQRSDPKVGVASDFPEGFGPQGDAIRVTNHARLVRDAD